MRNLKYITIFLLTIITFSSNAQTDKATTAKIVEERSFVFVATSATPLNMTDINNVLLRFPGNSGAGNINLSGDNYDLTVTKDSIVLYLPYYGRSYVANINPDDNGYKFTSKQFTYEPSKTKKGVWNILIKSKDVKDNVSMILSISKIGYASLNVVSNNKQSISYNGYLSELKVRKD